MEGFRALEGEGSNPSGPTYGNYKTAIDNIVDLVESAWNPRYWWGREAIFVASFSPIIWAGMLLILGLNSHIPSFDSICTFSL